MPPEQGSQRDLVLASNQYAFIQDETKGMIPVYVGPHNKTLAGTDKPVVYNSTTRKYEKSSLESAICQFHEANEESYIVLENPSLEERNLHPVSGASQPPSLAFGRKENIPGPVTFPLWPGQVATVIPGHHLRSNQYLVVRVYNEEAARQNWDRKVVKPATTPTPTPLTGQTPAGQSGENQTAPAPQADAALQVDTRRLTMGAQIVIKGTEASFFIPPTGVEVVPESAKQYVREAVTLERLEYCILLNEDGTKRFVPGPEVVFPTPTEVFVDKNGSRKFKAIELNDDMGLHVKVIQEYEEDGTKHPVGEELFITGRDQNIYFPREEHAIIRYGEQEVQYGVAIPEGEARYVLDKKTGKINLVRGPRIFLADPRNEVGVRRVLDERTIRLLYPGNEEAVEHNRGLRSLTQNSQNYVVEERLRGPSSRETLGAAKAALASFVGDDFRRSSSYTPPRSITLDTKYDGAVSMNVWTGYAVLVVRKDGTRRVVVGPQTALLEYDETVQVLQLSTGKPKTTDKLESTAYLRVSHNQVSDVVKVVTRDMVEVDAKLSYRVNFEGQAENWFNVENYVKFLCDHMRSLLRNSAKQHGIEEFNNDAINIIRNTILGAAVEGGKRSGRTFEENGMRVYDVEVLGLTIGDQRIAQMLASAQHETVQRTMQVASEHQRMEMTKRLENIKREIAGEEAETEKTRSELAVQVAEKKLDVLLRDVENQIKTTERKMAARVAEQESLNTVNTSELAREKAKQDQEVAVAQAELDQRLAELKAEVDAVVEKAKAVTPQFVSALQTFGDRHLAMKAAEAMSPMAILGGRSVADVMNQLLKGTVLGNVLGNGEISEGIVKRGEVS